MADPQPISWPDLAIGLYDRLTGRHAEIAYSYVKIPSDTTKCTTCGMILDDALNRRGCSNDPK